MILNNSTNIDLPFGQAHTPNKVFWVKTVNIGMFVIIFFGWIILQEKIRRGD
jgi:hypothetical protein